MTATISGATRLLFILGDPIAHASAPGLINTKLATLGIDAVMVPLHVPSTGLAASIAGLRATKNCAGAVITMPHKMRVIEHLDEWTDDAREVGAANVLRRAPDGRLTGALLDGEGFVAGLTLAGYRADGARVLLLGAGGAAAAIAFALARHGAKHLTVYNRTEASARALVARLNEAQRRMTAAVGGPVATHHDIVINATSLGMRTSDDPPLDLDSLEAQMLAAEVVITPERTAFLQRASERGCRVHPGRPMLECQIDLMLQFIGMDAHGQ